MGPERPLYYLVTTAGLPNLGDELIAQNWIEYLAQIAPDADVVLDCFKPQTLVAPIARAHPRLTVTSALWQLCFRNMADSARSAREVAAAVADPPRAGNLAGDIARLRRADVVHLLGGGFLNALWPGFLGLLAGIVTATERSGGTAAMTGLGLCPPIPGAEELLREFAARFAIIDVRDEPSARLLGGRARCSCDDAFLRLPGLRDQPADGLPEVMVSIHTKSALSQAPTARIVEFVSRTVTEWGAADVGLLECWPSSDAKVLALAERALPGVRRYSLAQVMRDGFPARPGQCWLSSRFHPHLFAAAAGASGVAINVRDDYYGTKHGSLLAQGSRWHLTGEDLAVPERPAAGGFGPANLAALRAAKLEVAQAIYGHRPRTGGLVPSGARTSAPALSPPRPITLLEAAMARTIRTGRWTTGNAEGIVIFLVGIRINKLRAIGCWLPVARAFRRVLSELNTEPEHGLLCHRTLISGPRDITMIQYWRTTEELMEFAHGTTHRRVWRDFYRQATRGPEVGIWHETYVVPPGQYESIYGSVPPLGLAIARGMVPVGRGGDSARGRLGIKEVT